MPFRICDYCTSPFHKKISDDLYFELTFLEACPSNFYEICPFSSKFVLCLYRPLSIPVIKGGHVPRPPRITAERGGQAAYIAYPSQAVLL